MRLSIGGYASLLIRWQSRGSAAKREGEFSRANSAGIGFFGIYRFSSAEPGAMIMAAQDVSG